MHNMLSCWSSTVRVFDEQYGARMTGRFEWLSVLDQVEWDVESDLRATVGAEERMKHDRFVIDRPASAGLDVV